MGGVTMSWNFESGTSLVQQIASRIRTEIIGGKYAPGDHFPAVRQLAFEASVNPNTVQKALTALESEGLLVARGTVGRFVTDDAKVIETARHTVRNEYLERTITEAYKLGITDEQIIEFIKERKRDQ